MPYLAAADRYERMQYRRCGQSGLKLPAVTLGLWHNFGGDVPLERSRAIVRRAFDLGITHFDLANNYGPPYGSAEEAFGKLLRDDLRPYRDELVIADKASFHNFVLQQKGKAAKTLTTVPFTGSKTVTVKLSKGAWAFYCAPHRSVMHGAFTVR